MDMDSYLRFVLSLALVLGLILLLAVALRRWGGRLGLPAGGGRGSPRRLQVVETTLVDARRRLLLVRCDDTEHLLLIGGPQDLVVAHDLRPQPAASGAASGFRAMLTATGTPDSAPPSGRPPREPNGPS